MRRASVPVREAAWGTGMGDAAVWVDGLRAAYRSSLAEGNAAWDVASARVRAGEVSASWLADAALLALATMGDGDPTSWGMYAADALRVHGEAKHAVAARALALPARPGLRDWRADVARAIDGIEERAAGRCGCAAEAGAGAPVLGPAWVVEASVSEPCLTRYAVRCGRCGAAYAVEEEEGYHTPIFRWTRA